MRIIFNGEPREVPTGTTVSQLLQSLKLDNRTLAVEVNLQLVPRGRHDQCTLAEGDRLEVVSLVGGG